MLKRADFEVLLIHCCYYSVIVRSLPKVNDEAISRLLILKCESYENVRWYAIYDLTPTPLLAGEGRLLRGASPLYYTLLR
jgi:hypothetical protein